MIIFVNMGLVVFVLILFFILVASGAAALLLKWILVICVLLCIKNLVQDIYFGMIKRRRSILAGIISIVINLFRVYVFYQLMRSYALLVINGVGLQWISNLLDFVIVLVLGGVLFLSGELFATTYGSKSGEIHSGAVVVGNLLITLFFTLFSFYCLSEI